MTNIDDKIWEPFEIPPRTRFLVTLILIFLPTIFNLFELLRFRLASLWIEDVVPKMCTNPVWQFFIIFVAKSVANFFLLLTWLSVSLVRNFWFRFRFETSRTSKKIGPHRKSTRLARTVAIRAQLIKGCTEASLQPLFQLYLLFNQFQTHSVSDVFIGSTEHYRYRQMVSVIISILALAISFTVNYRENKENSLGIVQTVCYLTYIIMSVVARTVCFEIYAFYLGPSWHWLIVAISCHVAVMTLLHFIFSDSYVQCLRSKSARQVMLVLHNCFVNGLANLYIHNNLEIFVRITDQGEASKMTSVEIENSQNKRKGSQGISMLKPTYGPIDIQQRTLVRQLFVDIIIFVENVSMVVIARQTMCQDLYLLSVKIIVVAYLAAIILKIAFYLCCHPWAELIRPHFANHPDENWKDNLAENLGQNREGHREGDQEENPDIIKEDSPDGVVKKHVVTSSVVLGRRVNIVVEGKYLRLERDDYKRDYLRHQSIEFGNIHSK